MDQSRNPEGDGQEQQHPSDEDSEAEGDDGHPRFCTANVSGYSGGTNTQAERKTIATPPGIHREAPSCGPTSLAASSGPSRPVSGGDRVSAGST